VKVVRDAIRDMAHVYEFRDLAINFFENDRDLADALYQQALDLIATGDFRLPFRRVVYTFANTAILMELAGKDDKLLVGVAQMQDASVNL
jgi:hypothetical protein